MEKINKTKTNGRRPKLDDITLDRLLNAIRLGSSYKDACAYAGVSFQTFFTWREKGERDRLESKITGYTDFLDQLEKTQVEVKLAMLTTVVKAGRTDWKAAIALLRARYPSEFGGSSVSDKAIEGGHSDGDLVIKVVRE